MVDRMVNKTGEVLTKYQVQELVHFLNFYLELKFCKKGKTDLETWHNFCLALDNIEQQKENLFHVTFDTAPEFRMFMFKHSVARIDAYDGGEWFERVIIEELNKVTDEQIKRELDGPPVPQWVLDKLAVFDPEPIGLELLPIRIECRRYGDPWPSDPITIVEPGMSGDHKIIDIENFIASYEPISCELQSLPAATGTMEEEFEIPF